MMEITKRSAGLRAVRSSSSQSVKTSSPRLMQLMIRRSFTTAPSYFPRRQSW